MALAEEFKRQGNFLFKYRGILPLLILGISMGVYLIEVRNKGGNLLGANYWYTCLCVSLLGQLIRIFTVGFAAKNTSGRNTGNQLADELNTKGIYSIVRHPLYVGNFLMWLGLCMLTQNLWYTVAFVFIYWVYYERIMYAEEAFLTSKFGERYLSWSSQIPAFWPNLRLWKPATLTFNLMKVIQREKNGISALFIIFWLFNFIGNGWSNGMWFLSYNFWFYAMVISSAYYVLIKVLLKLKVF